MKLFLNKILFFFILTVFLFVFYEYSLSFIPNSYNVKKKLIEEKKDSIKMIIVGTSRAFSGIIPSKMPYYSINIANNSQSIYYDIELLEKYIKKLPNINSIVFDINFFSFEYNLDNGPEEWRALYYNNIFNINPQSKNLSFIDNLFIKMYNPKDIIYHLSSIPIYNRYYKNKGVALNIGKSLINKENTKKRYKHLLNNYMSKKEKIKIIKKLENFLKSLKNSKIKIFFVQIPVSSEMYSNIDKKLLEENNNIINDFSKIYTNIKSINILNDNRFFDFDFRDSDHLNLNGAIKFSEILSNEINSTYPD